jgi:hypothetical protein
MTSYTCCKIKFTKDNIDNDLKEDKPALFGSFAYELLSSTMKIKKFNIKDKGPTA